MGARAEKQPRQWNSTLPARRAPWRASSHKGRPFQRAPRKQLKPGRKTQEWETARRKLKIAFEAAGITSCEVRCKGCWRDNALSFAHSKKRANIKGDEIYEVVLACASICHQILEEMPEARMTEVVRSIISHRITPVVLDL